MNLSPIARRRLAQFRRNKRGFYALIIVAILFVLSRSATCDIVNLRIEPLIQKTA